MSKIKPTTVIPSLRNHILVPGSSEELQALRAGKWDVYHPEEQEQVLIQGNEFKVRSGLTFTPYANPTKCNAHCRFCSEELLRVNQKELTAEHVIGDHDQYFAALAKALKDLSQIKNIGLSLSGLEATSDPKWLLRLLDLIDQENDVPSFNEKVLYTNSTGLYTHPELITALKKSKFDRLEISRCHYNEEVNQKVMYINRNEPVYKNDAYEDLIKRILPEVSVKNSCILTKTGIDQLTEIEQYLNWVSELGVKQVVFRELSRLDDTYIENKTKRWVEGNRVRIEPLLKEIMPQFNNEREGWSYEFSKAGYYYYNEHYTYQDQIEVILETSSYHELMDRNRSEVIQKLIFHSNGNLCGDWDPDSHVLANYNS